MLLSVSCQSHLFTFFLIRKPGEFHSNMKSLRSYVFVSCQSHLSASCFLLHMKISWIPLQLKIPGILSVSCHSDCPPTNPMRNMSPPLIHGLGLRCHHSVFQASARNTLTCSIQWTKAPRHARNWWPTSPRVKPVVNERCDPISVVSRELKKQMIQQLITYLFNWHSPEKM